MTTDTRVAPARYEPLMSDYLSKHKADERWTIKRIDWDGTTLKAHVCLTGWTSSETDSNRFHVSIFSLREIDAQLGIIGLHLKLGLERKTAEVWLLKCIEECRKAIRDPDNVMVSMTFDIRPTTSGKLLSERRSTITDPYGGLIDLSITTFLPHDFRQVSAHETDAE
jgi:hypothetical protein